MYIVKNFCINAVYNQNKLIISVNVGKIEKSVQQ